MQEKRLTLEQMHCSSPEATLLNLLQQPDSHLCGATVTSSGSFTKVHVQEGKQSREVMLPVPTTHLDQRFHDGMKSAEWKEELVHSKQFKSRSVSPW